MKPGTISLRHSWSGATSRLLLWIGAFVVVGFVAAIFVIRALRANSQATKPVFETDVQHYYPQIVAAMIAAGGRAPNGGSLTPVQLLELAGKDGLQRLDDQSILSLAKMRANLAASADTQACASMWSGRNPAATLRAIESLPPEQQHQWAELYKRAAVATLNNDPIRTPPSAERIRAAGKNLYARFSADELAVAQQEASHDATHDCEAARLFYKKLAQVNDTDTITLTRGLLYGE